MNFFDDLLALDAYGSLASERPLDERQLYRHVAELILQALENTLMARLFRPLEEGKEEAFSCFHIFPGMCCMNCHQRDDLDAMVLRDGRDILCCCQASSWLADHDLLLQQLSVGFKLF